jgi:pyruvate kinase
MKVGMDAARLNFSHGNYELHKTWIYNIRQASKMANKHIAIIQDLQGPKIRIGKVENDAIELIDGQEFIITCSEINIGNSRVVGTSYKYLCKEVEPGKIILLDDGYLILQIEKIRGNDIYTKVIKGGKLKNNKGIIVPGTKSHAPAISDKDMEDLKFGLENNIDIVAFSFVRSQKDIVELKAIMKAYNKTKPVIAKIERPEAIDNIDDIIEEADAIMIARGDLGLELPIEQVPLIQKQIIKKCNYYGKPVITATQMLESMIENPMPTRAEASDIANAVLDGSDCLMLSGETSIGKFPIDAVK